MNFERKNIRVMAGYVPGEQPELQHVIKLNTNENPFPPGPFVTEALSRIRVEDLRRYPPPTASRLRSSIAAFHETDEDNIIVTNGGDELLRLAINTFVEENEKIAVAEPSYSLYPVLAQARGCGLVSFELTDNWELPEDFASMLNDAGVKMCLLPNPNAPSGALHSADELAGLAGSFNGMLLIDEAYVDFVDPVIGHNCVPMIADMDNVLILRSFSKGYSLAGLRIGYGLGPVSLIAPMQGKTKDSYNVDYIAQTLAEAAIRDQGHAQKTWLEVREQRTWLLDALGNLDFSCIPSQSNFILASVPGALSAEALYRALKEAGILVRYFKQPRLENKLRITVGTAEENRQLIAVLKKITAGG